MNYALLQKEAAPPGAEPLKRAFKTSNRFTDPDAAFLAQAAYGVLLKDLTYDEAYRIHRGLAEEGIAAEVVAGEDLPVLPEAKVTRRLEVKDSALVVFDALGRPQEVPWSRLILIAAGEVRHFGTATKRVEERVVAYTPMRGLHTTTVTDLQHKTHSTQQLLLDLVFTDPWSRLQIEPANFLFGYVVNQPNLELEEKCGALVGLLAAHAPHAVLNRGAACLREGRDPATYSSKAALLAETVWLLWKLKTAS